ncbi:hypothetical protein EIZ39_24820 [Ammoniphilus sp. CFH 90114]|nr:hypothetical protein EIZ39_24820 [Ammoniphilus sp. CFH 90114]
MKHIWLNSWMNDKQLLLSSSNKQEIRKLLKLDGINNRTQRLARFWELQHYVESLTYHHAEEIEEATSFAVKSWNEKSSLKIDQETVKSILPLERVEMFKSICTGEQLAGMETREAWLVQLLLRFAICEVQSLSSVVGWVKHVLQTLWGDSPDREVKAALKVMGFRKNQSLDLEMLEKYRSLFKGRLVYSKGLRNLLQPILSSEDIAVIEMEQPSKKKESQEIISRDMTSEESMMKILEAIGGSSSEYLLSELYDESMGNLPANRVVSVGRLINFFSILNLHGIESYSGGLEKDRIFHLKRDELAKTFMTRRPIQSKEDEIPIQLVQCGWTFHGKVMILPLIEEVILEKERK